jgi:predicted alpha/beta-hydrolase family hydrolase
MKVQALQRGGVRGFLHIPDSETGLAVAITHGAGANCGSQLLIAIAEAFCRRGMTVLRFDLPFRQERPFGPPVPAQAARDREGIAEAAEVLRELTRCRIYLGGHSYGGRQASMVAAEQPGLAVGLLLLSYPLHPPKKPAQLRTAHWPNLKVPALFVHGTNDTFGTVEELQSAIEVLQSADLIVVPGAGHDLKKGGIDKEQIVDRLMANRTRN